MRVVLDTNVIVSAFLSPLGKPAAILRLVLQHELDICVDTTIVIEYEQVLCRPQFTERIQQSSIQCFFEILYDIGININSIPSHIPLPDESDRKFYDIAKAAGAYLVTGNLKHYPDEAFIQDPATFMNHFTS